MCGIAGIPSLGDKFISLEKELKKCICIAHFKQSSLTSNFLSSS